jgi:hypothetical protein
MEDVGKEERITTGLEFLPVRVSEISIGGFFCGEGAGRAAGRSRHGRQSFYFSRGAVPGYNSFTKPEVLRFSPD